MSFAESFSPSSQHKRLCLWQDHWSGEWTMTSVTGNIEELLKLDKVGGCIENWSLRSESFKFGNDGGGGDGGEEAEEAGGAESVADSSETWTGQTWCWTFDGPSLASSNSMMIMMMACPALWYVEPYKCGTVPTLLTPATPRSMKKCHIPPLTKKKISDIFQKIWIKLLYMVEKHAKPCPWSSHY